MSKWRLEARDQGRKSIGCHLDNGVGRKEKAKQKPKNTNASKLCNIVNKIMASKTGEDCAVASEDEKSDGSADNYNIYE